MPLPSLHQHDINRGRGSGVTSPTSPVRRYLQKQAEEEQEAYRRFIDHTAGCRSCKQPGVLCPIGEALRIAHASALRAAR